MVPVWFANFTVWRIRFGDGWRLKMMTFSSSTNDTKPRYFFETDIICLPYNVHASGTLDLITFVSQTPSNAPYFKLFYFKNVWSSVIFSNDHDMHIAPDPLDLITNAFWLSSISPHLFVFYFLFWFLYLIVLNFKKIIENSF